MNQFQEPPVFEAVNRNAILVKPKLPFRQWSSKIYPDHQVDFKEDHNVYLIREMASNDEVRTWLQKNFDMIFAYELNEWDADENNWPQQRDYSVFNEWFDIEVHSMILDLESTELIKE